MTIRDGALELAARACPKVTCAGLTPGDIVDNKLLGAALTHIREQQQLRERTRLAKARTRRDRRSEDVYLHADVGSEREPVATEMHSGLG